MNYETDRDHPTKSDGIYTPGTHREIYQKISTDYQEIVALTNLINVGRPLPLAEIMLLYEVGMHTRIGASNRALRGFARDPSRSKEFPDSAAFYESDTFLDSPISNAVRLRGEADGDFDLHNQYETRSYESFFDHPDGLWQQSVPLPDRDLLSPHNPDLSILLIPHFALGGLVGAQVQFLLLAAAAMALEFVLADRLTGRRLVSWVISLGVNSRDLVPPVQQQGRHSCPDDASTSRQQNSQSRAILSGTLLNVEFPPRVHGPLPLLGSMDNTRLLPRTFIESFVEKVAGRPSSDESRYLVPRWKTTNMPQGHE